MLEIKPIHHQFVDQIIKFESDNRAFFEQYVPCRPPEYFKRDKLISTIKDQMLEMQLGRHYMHLILKDDELIGRINLTDVKEVDGHKQAELGYRITDKVSGKGYGKQAISQILQIAKLDYKIDKIIARVDPSNIASTKIIESQNFSRTQMIKDAAKLNGKMIDFTIYEKQL